jgi:hypothetical protein
MEFLSDAEEADERWCVTAAPDSPPLEKPARASRPRCRYGSGIDAQRTAPFRFYPMDRSLIYRHLEKSSGTVTKELLMSIVAGTLEQAPPEQRPPPPTRSQKRSKAGLVTWLDTNTALVMGYLRSLSVSA